MQPPHGSQSSPFMSPGSTGGGGATAVGSRLVVLSGSTLHIIGVPLLIVGVLGVGFILVYLKEVLLPFVISILIVYLLRPLVNTLTTPFGQCCCCRCAMWCRRGAPPHPSSRSVQISSRGAYSRVPSSAEVLNESESSSGAQRGPTHHSHYSRRRVPSPPKYPRTLRGMVTRAVASAQSLLHSATSVAGSAGGLLMSGVGTSGARAARAAESAATSGNSAVASDDDAGRPATPLHQTVGSSAATSASKAGAISRGDGPGGGVAGPAGGHSLVLGPSVASSHSGVAAAAAVGASHQQQQHAFFVPPPGGSVWAGGGGGAAAPYDTAAGTGAVRGRGSPIGTAPDAFAPECGCCCGFMRMTRAPRWFAILVSLLVAGLVLSGLVLMCADAIQRFQAESLELFVASAKQLAQDLQRWLADVLDVHVDAAGVLAVAQEHVSVVTAVQSTLVLVMEGVGNLILIMLLVLYLLAEQESHSSGSLRARVDSQIERYLVLKTAISAAQGACAYAILSLLGVRMPQLFGVLHFLLNYIPTAGPILATAVPLPVVVLDPALGVTAKVAAFVAPTVMHMVVGNVLEPLVFGSSMEVHPVTVLLSLAIWYALWGVPGAILAVPITAVMRISLSAVAHPYARILVNALEGRLSAAISGARESVAQEQASAESLSAASAAAALLQAQESHAAAAAAAATAAAAVAAAAAGGLGSAGGTPPRIVAAGGGAPAGWATPDAAGSSSGGWQAHSGGAAAATLACSSPTDAALVAHAAATAAAAGAAAAGSFDFAAGGGGAEAPTAGAAPPRAAAALLVTTTDGVEAAASAAAHEGPNGEGAITDGASRSSSHGSAHERASSSKERGRSGAPAAAAAAGAAHATHPYLHAAAHLHAAAGAPGPSAAHETQHQYLHAQTRTLADRKRS